MKITVEWASGEKDTIRVKDKLGYAIADGLATVRMHSLITVECKGKQYELTYPNPHGASNPEWKEVITFQASNQSA